MDRTCFASPTMACQSWDLGNLVDRSTPWGLCGVSGCTVLLWGATTIGEISATGHKVTVVGKLTGDPSLY